MGGPFFVRPLAPFICHSLLWPLTFLRPNSLAIQWPLALPITFAIKGSRSVGSLIYKFFSFLYNLFILIFLEKPMAFFLCQECKGHAGLTFRTPSIYVVVNIF